jgi:hypothetical protein
MQHHETADVEEDKDRRGMRNEDLKRTYGVSNGRAGGGVLVDQLLFAVGEKCIGQKGQTLS